MQLNPISSRPFHFKIHPITSYIDLSKVYLITECRIRAIGADGVITELSDEDVVSPIQSIGSTWIRDLKILITQREIYSSTQLYSYKAFLDTEFSYPTTAKDGFLSVTGYARDIADPDSISDDGFVARKNMFARSKKVQLISKLSADILNQDLFLISNVEVDFEINVQPDEFLLIQKKITGKKAEEHPKYTFEITDVRLMIKTLDVFDALSLEIARRLDTEPARYGIRKTFLKSLFITQGTTEYVANLFTEEVPRRVMIGLVKNSRYIGNKHESPFKFTHFNVRDIELRANGRTYPQYLYK